jgi:type IV secretion system protein VirB5
MRRTALAAALTIALGLGAAASTAVASGIPVFDAASLTQAMQQVMHMVEQIKQLKAQLETAQRQLDAMSGVRGKAGVIDSTYDKSTGVEIGDILNAEGIHGAGHYGLTGDVGELYDTGNRDAAEWVGQSQKFLGQAVHRFDELSRLVAEVNQAPEQKDVLDLQARIQAEDVLLQNELAKLQMVQSQAMARQAMNAQRALQMKLNMKGEGTTRFAE